MSTDDTPIEPQAFTSGVSVIDIGDLRVARGLTRRPRSSCAHRHQVFDSQERRIYCTDCESTVDPFDAFVGLVSQLDSALKDLNRRRDKIKAAEAHTLVSRAAKAMDQQWRRRDSVPCCPYCDTPLFPEDVLARRLRTQSKTLAAAARKKSKG